MRVSCVAEPFRETRVEFVFVGPRRSLVRYFNSQPSESRSGDENKQRAISDPTLRKIGETLFDELFARQQ